MKKIMSLFILLSVVNTFAHVNTIEIPVPSDASKIIVSAVVTINKCARGAKFEIAEMTENPGAYKITVAQKALQFGCLFTTETKVREIREKIELYESAEMVKFYPESEVPFEVKFLFE